EITEALVLGESVQSDAAVRQRLADLLQAHNGALFVLAVGDDSKGPRQRTTVGSGLYRQLVSLVSLHSREPTGVASERQQSDTVLAFELAARKPSADELDSEDERVKASLSRVRSDLRIAVLNGELAGVFRL